MVKLYKDIYIKDKQAVRVKSQADYFLKPRKSDFVFYLEQRLGLKPKSLRSLNKANRTDLETLLIALSERNNS